MSTKLSVNINKIALIRNSRGANFPDILKVASDIERFDADGITVHPRPDERHITFNDVYELKRTLKTELNVEGNPDARFLKMVLEVIPHQVTLVPDAPNALTSNAGWDTLKFKSFLTDICRELKSKNIRTSIFVDPNPEMIIGAKDCGVDRIELYTEVYSKNYRTSPSEAIKDYILAAQTAHQFGLGINAGHDLNLENLGYFSKNIPNLEEVSIGHALVVDSLYFGLESTIGKYKTLLV